jgi:hypothetical protein
MKNIGLITNTNPLLLEKNLRSTDSFAENVDNAMGGNTGNVGFIHGTSKLLGDKVHRIGWGDNPQSIKKHIDHIVVCCANQIGEHVDLEAWAKTLEEYDRPVTLIGLGAQANSKDEYPQIPNGTKKFLDVVSQKKISRSSNILVRGAYTQSVLEMAGYDSIPAGCPSLLISDLPDLGKDIVEYSHKYPPSRIAVAAGNPWHTTSASLECKLVSIVNQWRGEYIIQHPLAMLKFALGESELIDEATRSRFSQVYAATIEPSELSKWFLQNSIAFTDAQTWMRFLRKFDLTIGPRYHGIALAIQSGRPGMVITIDSRTQELCESTGVKHLPVKDALKLSINELIEKAAWSDADGEYLDQARTLQAEHFSTAFMDNGLSPSAHAIAQTGWSVKP